MKPHWNGRKARLNIEIFDKHDDVLNWCHETLTPWRILSKTRKILITENRFEAYIRKWLKQTISLRISWKVTIGDISILYLSFIQSIWTPIVINESLQRVLEMHSQLWNALKKFKYFYIYDFGYHCQKYTLRKGINHLSWTFIQK